MPYVSPYTVTVTSTAGGMAQCSYVDATGASVPPGTVLTTTTPPGLPGSLQFKFVEGQVGTQMLRLVGAAVKTVGHDPTMSDYNYLFGTRQPGGVPGQWIDCIDVPWGVDMYNTRGVVLLFAQLDANNNMLNFYPSSDPQVRNVGTAAD